MLKLAPLEKTRALHFQLFQVCSSRDDRFDHVFTANDEMK